MEKEIKIFVSRRIDIDSVAVDNPLYVPVRCGAVYDENENSPYLGDDTGDNVSEKRFPYSELTVQYWAWKNIEADYYGLCHYRRYLSFSDNEYKANHVGVVHYPALDEKGIERFNLKDEKYMRQVIEAHDAVFPKPATVSKPFFPKGRIRFNTIDELWRNAEGLFFDKGLIERMFQLIDELAPEYSKSAREYFAGNKHYGCNCYIMRRELLDRLCNLQYPIMEIIHKESNDPEYKRVPAYVGEMLYGIFIYHLKTYENWKICERQLAFFSETEHFKHKSTLYILKILFFIRSITKPIVEYFFPAGSEKWEIIVGAYKNLNGKIKKIGE